MVDAQAPVVHGTVTDSLTQTGLYPANVVLQERDTRNYLKGTITNESGYFKISGISHGAYILTVSYIGYRSIELPVSVGNEKQTDLGNIRLATAPVQIGEVEILYKPIVQYGDNSDVTLNLDMLGDLGEQSVYDVIHSLVGLYTDFDDKIRYNGYTDFTTLINGKRLGANFQRVGVSGNFQTYMLKRIPAKYIKTVEILPEPRGRYGYYAPIINLITKGNLLDFYTMFSEAGVKDKYGLGLGVSKVWKKLTLTPEISYKHPAVFSQENEDREYDTNPDNSFTRNSDSHRWGIEKKAALSAAYHFEDTHALTFSAEGDFIENTSDITRNTLYADGQNNWTKDSRDSDSPEYKYQMGYRKSFYVGDKKSLRMNMNASMNRNTEETIQNIADLTGTDTTKEYRSNTTKESKNADMRLNYHNLKHRFHYLFDVKFSFHENDDDASRKLFNHSSNSWDELNTFSSDQTFSRLSSDLSFTLLRKYEVKKNDKTVYHTFRANIRENLNTEKITDHLENDIRKERNARTSFGLNYLGHFSTYGSLSFKYNGWLSRPTADQLLETPVYIDDYTIKIGNSDLKSEMVNTLNFDYTWNDANVISISKNTSIIPPRYGYSIRGTFTTSSNKIVSSRSVDDDGILTYSYKNSSGKQSLSMSSDFYSRISTFINLKLGLDYKYDTYSDNAESIRSGNSWAAKSSVSIKFFKRIKLETKYQYNSPRILYQGKQHAYHDGSVSLSALVWKDNIDLSLEVTNILSHSGVETDYYGDNYSYQTVRYPECPIIWFRAALMLFKFR